MDPITMAMTFDHAADYSLDFTDAGTKVVDLGTLGPNGAKLLLVRVEPDASPTAQPVMVALNGAATGHELSPGGALLLASPKPTAAGALSLSITRTSSAVVKVWVLG